MAHDLVTLERDDKIAILTFNNPDCANALSVSMATRFAERIAEVRGISDLRVLIITGAGRHFSAGGDLEMLHSLTAGDHDPERKRENTRRMREFYDRLLCVRQVQVPVIAALNGAAVGAGLCLALACDLRMVSETARLGFTFSRLGLHPGLGATYFLPRIVGSERAMYLLATGRTVGGQEAVTMGLALECRSADDLMPTTRALAQEIVVSAPLAVRQTKESLAHSFADSLDVRLAAEASAQAANYAGPDVAEGILALRERRHPRF